MNVTPTDTLTATDQRNLLAWIAETNAVITAASQPIEVGDPKRDIIAAKTGVQVGTQLSPELLGQLFATRCVELPPCPLPTPSWSVVTSVSESGYGELAVEYRGRRHGDHGGPSASITWTRCVVSMDYVAPDGEEMVAGTIIPADPLTIDFEWNGGDTISWKEAASMAVVLASASTELREIEEAGR